MILPTSWPNLGICESVLLVATFESDDDSRVFSSFSAGCPCSRPEVTGLPGERLMVRFDSATRPRNGKGLIASGSFTSHEEFFRARPKRQFWCHMGVVHGRIQSSEKMY